MKVLIFAVLVAVTAAQSTTELPVCQDDPASDCWSRPNKDCFGLYEAWSRAHCGLRCGYCGTPPCEDVLDNCDRFGSSSCIDENFAVWARQNCRKSCNLCNVTNPNTTTVTGQTTGSSNSDTPPPVTGETPEEVTTPSGGVHSVATGTVHTFVLIGEPAFNTDNCTYKGFQYPPQSRWNDGCEFECACMDAKINRIVCQERCTRWETTAALGNCRLLDEQGECCRRLECL